MLVSGRDGHEIGIRRRHVALPGTVQAPRADAPVAPQPECVKRARSDGHEVGIWRGYIALSERVVTPDRDRRVVAERYAVKPAARHCRNPRVRRWNVKLTK